MTICLAQIRSKKGKIEENIELHLEMVERAIAQDANLIVFPELSITNYEPEIAGQYATDITDDIFDPFQVLSDQHEINICVGMPIRAPDNEGINISLIIFQPNQDRKVYAKQMLHDDELPFFTSGNSQMFINIKGKNCAFAICYESLQREHFTEAVAQGMDIYIASVAKPQLGVEKTYDHFPKLATEFKIPILMSNCVGPCDNFVGAGQSAVWGNNGRLLKQLDSTTEGVLLFEL